MLRFCDSFDHWVSGDYAYKWDNNGFDFFGQAGITTGRFGSGFQMGAGNHGLIKTLSSENMWTLGVAIYCTGGVAGGIVVHVADAGTNQVETYLDPTTHLLSARRNGTVLGTGTTPVPVGAFVYVEMQAVIDNATGSVIVRLEGNDEVNLSGVDTQATANATADQVGIGRNIGANLHHIDFDDFYACDGTDSGVVGAPNNDFLGDVRVDCLFPNGNGNSSDFLGSDSDQVNNYLLVDEALQNGDTDYVETSTISFEDTYAYSNIGSSGDVYGIQMLPFARKTDAGTREIATVTRLAATEEDSTDLALSTSYAYLRNIREADPNGDQWDETSINAMEAGYKLTV